MGAAEVALPDVASARGAVRRAPGLPNGMEAVTEQEATRTALQAALDSYEAANRTEPAQAGAG